MIRAMQLSESGHLRTDLQSMDISFALQDAAGLLWVDMESVLPQEAEPLLVETFKFHPLAVRNSLREEQFPKIDDWGNYLNIVIHSVKIDASHAAGVQMLELDIFLGKNYIVTIHDGSMPSIQNTWEAVQRDSRQIQQGVDHILYRIADEIANTILHTVEQIDEKIDGVEAEVFRVPRREILEQMFSLKRAVVSLRRIIAPQQVVFGRLAREEFAVIDLKDRIYFRDVFDHMTRLYDQVEGVRDLVTGAMDTYLSMSNQRLSDIMRMLTFITTIFMPLSFVTSFFGMNFFFPEQPIHLLMEPPALVAVMIALVLIPAAMITWMRRRGWLGG